MDSLVKNAQAKEVDSGENLIVLVPNDTGVFQTFEGDTTVKAYALAGRDKPKDAYDICYCLGYAHFAPTFRPPSAIEWSTGLRGGARST